jgi:hypothetical protein
MDRLVSQRIDDRAGGPSGADEVRRSRIGAPAGLPFQHVLREFEAIVVRARERIIWRGIFRTLAPLLP